MKGPAAGLAQAAVLASLIGCGAGQVERADADEAVQHSASDEQAQPTPVRGGSGARPEPQEPRGSGARAEPALPGPLTIPRPALDRVVAAGPGALLAQVVLQPERGSDNKFIGFRIVSLFGDTPEVLRYGVRPGDLLLSSQGQRIVTPGDLLTVFQRLRGARSVEVQVRRAGATVVLQWPVVEAGWRAQRPAAVNAPQAVTPATGR